MRSLLNELKHLPKSVIYAIRNDSSKKIYISQTSRFLTAIDLILKELDIGTFKCKEMIKDFDKLQIEVLEVMEDIETRKLHVQYWKDKFKELGYKEYIETRPPLEYKVVTRVTYDCKYVIVYLVNKRYEYKPVGVFNTIKEANTFVIENYTSKYIYPVYACNNETKQLIQKSNKGIALMY